MSNDMRKLMEAVNGISEEDFQHVDRTAVGHVDDEQHAIRKELDNLNTYSQELSDMVAGLPGDADFPHWWTKKVSMANELLSKAKHYLEGELRVPDMNFESLEETVLSEDTAEIADELEEIQGHMLDLLGEAENLVSGTDEYDRARSYWIAHITTALTDDHGYLGGSMANMQQTIDALREGDDDDYDDEDDDDTYAAAARANEL